MKIDTANLEVRKNDAEHRFEVTHDGQLAELEFFQRGDVLTLVHTSVPKALEGNGIAGHLTKHVLDYARREGLRVVPRCPYAQSYIDRHPEYEDLVEPAL